MWVYDTVLLSESGAVLPRIVEEIDMTGKEFRMKRNANRARRMKISREVVKPGVKIILVRH